MTSTAETRTSTAHVPTDRPGRYAKQLAGHMGRRAETGWDDETGRGFVRLPLGEAEMVAVDGGLNLTATGTDLDALEDVIGRHLVRFGTRDELVVEWVRDDGGPGTTQRNTDAPSPDHRPPGQGENP